MNIALRKGLGVAHTASAVLLCKGRHANLSMHDEVSLQLCALDSLERGLACPAAASRHPRSSGTTLGGGSALRSLLWAGSPWPALQHRWQCQLPSNCQERLLRVAPEACRCGCTFGWSACRVSCPAVGWHCSLLHASSPAPDICERHVTAGIAAASHHKHIIVWGAPNQCTPICESLRWCGGTCSWTQSCM